MWLTLWNVIMNVIEMHLSPNLFKIKTLFGILKQKNIVLVDLNEFSLIF